MKDAAAIYAERYETSLVRVADRLGGLVSSHVEAIGDIDQVSARAKHPEHFAEKARRTDETGHPKYSSPLTEIQDQVGARIVVFYEGTVREVLEVVRRYFQPIEEKELVPDSFWEFGYFGTHLVLALPADAIPADVDLSETPRFFELQIKTLFQHAWSQANHDLGYKAPRDLSGDQKRRLAFTAAQAWGADRTFQELQAELA